ncbi:MAG: hypothetical protein RLZZ244_1927 [Verrucomicrobiota bacterium]|jgi:pyruvate/2-oxoglutarate dehydrogenase complex dihydrolipoamide dehydrogenase (E3) component
MQTFDFVVLGGGSAGYAAASTAARLGLRTAVIEGGREVGGLCILRGCMPSKTLLASSQRAAEIRRASEFGIRATFEGVDLKALQERKRLLIGEFATYRRSQLESGRFTFLRGMARFLDPHRIEVTPPQGPTSVLQASTCLIATGSRIQPPPIPGLLETGYLDSDAFLEAEHLPESILILGGGAIALEAASFYAGFGKTVTLLQRSPRVLKEADPDVSLALQEGLRHQGVRILTGVRLQRVEKAGALKRVHFTLADSDAPRCEEAEEIVMALGRVPATENLQLESVGVSLLHGRIPTALTQQTNHPHLFAAGDVCGPLEVVHIAIQQGEIAARNAHRLLHHPEQPLESIHYRLKLLAVFSDPGVASLGLTEAEAQNAGIPFRTASYPFNDHGKSMVEGHKHGFVKLLAHAESREILGASVVGPHAAELIHEISVAMAFHATARDLAQIPHYHPTLSEIWTYPAEELSD